MKLRNQRLELKIAAVITAKAAAAAECPLMTVVSTGRRNTLSWREKMECIARDQRFRRGFTATEKTKLWNPWQREGISLKAIG
jgi:hypothetical protein